MTSCCYSLKRLLRARPNAPIPPLSRLAKGLEKHVTGPLLDATPTWPSSRRDTDRGHGWDGSDVQASPALGTSPPPANKQEGHVSPVVSSNHQKPLTGEPEAGPFRTSKPKSNRDSFCTRRRPATLSSIHSISGWTPVESRAPRWRTASRLAGASRRMGSSAP